MYRGEPAILFQLTLMPPATFAIFTVGAASWPTYFKLLLALYGPSSVFLSFSQQRTVNWYVTPFFRYFAALVYVVLVVVPIFFHPPLPSL